MEAHELWLHGQSLHGAVGWVLLPAPHSPCWPVGASGPLQALCSGLVLLRGATLSNWDYFVPSFSHPLLVAVRLRPVHCDSCNTSHVLLFLSRHVFHIAVPLPHTSTAWLQLDKPPAKPIKIFFWPGKLGMFLHLLHSPALLPSLLSPYFFLCCFTKLCFFFLNMLYLRNSLNCNKQPTETLH